MSTHKHIHRRGAEAARGAHNSEVTRSKRVAGIFQFVSFKEAGRHSSRDVKHEHTQTIHRCGAEAARGAHNSEVTGSKPVAGIFQFACFKEVRRHSSRDVKHEHKHKPFAGVAQRQSA